MNCFHIKKGLTDNKHIKNSVDKYILDREFIYTIIDINGIIIYQNDKSKDFYKHDDDILARIFKLSSNLDIEEFIKCIRLGNIYMKNIKIFTPDKRSNSSERTSLDCLSNKNLPDIEVKTNHQDYKIHEITIKCVYDDSLKNSTLYVYQKDINDGILSSLLSTLGLLHVQNSYPQNILDNLDRDIFFDETVNEFENISLLLLEVNVNDVSNIEYCYEISNCFLKQIMQLMKQYNIIMNDQISNRFLFSSGLFYNSKNGLKKCFNSSSYEDTVIHATSIIKFAINILELSKCYKDVIVKISMHNGNCYTGLLYTTIPKLCIQGECYDVVTHILNLAEDNTIITTDIFLSLSDTSVAYNFLLDLTINKSMYHLYQISSKYLNPYDKDLLNINTDERYIDTLRKINISHVKHFILEKNLNEMK